MCKDRGNVASISILTAIPQLSAGKGYDLYGASTSKKGTKKIQKV